ncbi:hypothetical protein B0H13DRAFT_1933872 [Mycena leptocephala]|nr:hypothetical protein B0H13DRAFT_1933872 [Mycena leptocephala]
MFGDPCLGALDIRLDALVKLCAAAANSKAASLELVGIKGASKGKPSATLLLRMGSVTPDQAKSAIDAAQNAVAARGLGSTNLMASAGDLASGLQGVVSKLDLVLQIGEEFAQIHPYVNAAWKILTSVYEAVKKQQETDDKVLQLLQTMVEVYSFAEDVEYLSDKIRQLRVCSWKSPGRHLNVQCSSVNTLDMGSLVQKSVYFFSSANK